MSIIEIPVLVVGGGGTGLSIANFLADLDVDFLLLERHKTTSIQPKAHYINQRSMEIYRRHGLADAIYRAAAPRENMGKILWCTSIGGDGPIDRKTFIELDLMGGGGLREIYDLHGSAAPAHIPQLLLEPILFGAASARRPERMLFEHELISFTQDERGVLAIVRDHAKGQDFQVRARYMVGADAGKTVGPALGVTMRGLANLADFVSAHFSADLSSYLDRDDAAMRMVMHPDKDGTGMMQGGLISMGPDRWDRHCRQWTASWAQGGPGHAAPAEGSDDESAVISHIRAFLKIDAPIDLHRVSHWELGSLIADSFRSGHVFLAGDAAHKTTPIGGLGLNSGIQDAHNLAWKLAMVLKGKAGETLLESYEIERRPVVAHNIDMSMFGAVSHRTVVTSMGIMPGTPPGYNEAQIALLLADTPGGAARRARMREVFGILRPEYAGQDHEIGFSYGNGALIDDGAPPAPNDPMGTVYTPSTRPGRRLPHVWLQQDGKVVSTHDLVPFEGFLLLTSERGGAWIGAAETVSAQLGVMILACTVGGADADIQDPDGAWKAVSELDDDGAVLVRPDGHVAYRARAGTADATAALNDAIKAILANT